MKKLNNEHKWKNVSGWEIKEDGKGYDFLPPIHCIFGEKNVGKVPVGRADGLVEFKDYNSGGGGGVEVSFINASATQSYQGIKIGENTYILARCKGVCKTFAEFDEMRENWVDADWENLNMGDYYLVLKNENHSNNKGIYFRTTSDSTIHTFQWMTDNTFYHSETQPESNVNYYQTEISIGLLATDPILHIVETKLPDGNYKYDYNFSGIGEEHIGFQTPSGGATLAKSEYNYEMYISDSDFYSFFFATKNRWNLNFIYNDPDQYFCVGFNNISSSTPVTEFNIYSSKTSSPGGGYWLIGSGSFVASEKLININKNKNKENK